jgi:hypothetical protein
MLSRAELSRAEPWKHYLEYYQSYDLSRELAHGSLPGLPGARGHPTYGTTPNRLVANGGNDEWGGGHLPARRQWPAWRLPQDILAAICPFQGAAVLSRTHMLPHSRIVLPWDPVAIRRSAVSGTQCNASDRRASRVTRHSSRTQRLRSTLSLVPHFTLDQPSSHLVLVKGGISILPPTEPMKENSSEDLFLSQASSWVPLPFLPSLLGGVMSEFLPYDDFTLFMMVVFRVCICRVVYTYHVNT